MTTYDQWRRNRIDAFKSMPNPYKPPEICQTCKHFGDTSCTIRSEGPVSFEECPDHDDREL